MDCRRPEGRLFHVGVGALVVIGEKQIPHDRAVRNDKPIDFCKDSKRNPLRKTV